MEVEKPCWRAKRESSRGAESLSCYQKRSKIKHLKKRWSRRKKPPKVAAVQVEVSVKIDGGRVARIFFFLLGTMQHSLQ